MLSQRTEMLHTCRQTNLLKDIFSLSFLLTYNHSLFSVKDNVTFCYFSTINFQPWGIMWKPVKIFFLSLSKDVRRQIKSLKNCDFATVLISLSWELYSWKIIYTCSLLFCNLMSCYKWAIVTSIHLDIVNLGWPSG